MVTHENPEPKHTAGTNHDPESRTAKTNHHPTTVRVSAPGRVGLIGGYSILESGNTSFSFTVDASVDVKLAGLTTIPDQFAAPQRKENPPSVHIKLPEFKIDTLASWKKSYENPAGKLVLERDPKEAIFAKASVQAVFEYLEFRQLPIKPFSLTSESDSVFTQGGGKTGLGSSAAATVAMVHGILAWHNIHDLTITHHCAQAAHSRGQGKIGSGYDVAASVSGSQEYQRYSTPFVEKFPKTADKAWDYLVRPLQVPEFFHAAIATFPNESSATVSMTKLVSGWKAKHLEDYDELIHDLNDANVDAIAYMEQLHSEKTEENLSLFQDFFEAGRLLTRQLGQKCGAPIETPDMTELIDQSLENGAFVCKAPGAGGKDNLVALCTNNADLKKLKAFWMKKGLEPLDVKIQNLGVQMKKG